jgi:DivIVA domain-containing protein
MPSSTEPLNTDEVQNIHFPNAPIGRRGYAKHEVDEFMARIHKTLHDEDDLTAAEVHHVAFSKPLVGRRGYDERQVDHFLDRAEDAISERTGLRGGHIPLSRRPSEATMATPGTPSSVLPTLVTPNNL